MASYLITYDNHPPRQYGNLYQLMATWNAVRLAESVWAVDNLLGPADVVRDIVLRTLQPNDTVVVTEIKAGSDWATNCASPAANAWLSAYVTPSKKAA